MSISDAPVVARLFAAEVTAAEVFGDGDPALLCAEERAETTAMGPSRLRQYSGGRACAHAALDALGVERAPLLSGDDRPPVWPEGITGSISHTRTWCGAVTGRRDDPAIAGGSLGLDGEAVGRVTERLWRRLFVAEELAHLNALTDPTLAATVMFSVKEAYYKAQYPHTRSWVGFDDVRIEWLDVGVRLHKATGLDALDAMAWPVDARWERRDDLVVTGVISRPISSGGR